MASDSDDDDTFVRIGTPLEPYEEDETIQRRPVQLQDQTVKDSRGRQRFHGAFTGGFSAGYFNTVGSKDGFTPSTFVSSRDKKEAETAAPGSRPEDFMDEEDLGEHGIAPRRVQATDAFRPAEVDRRKRPLPAELRGTGVIPGDDILADIVVPSRVPMGMRLLRKLGWKDGQGIGPRQASRRKRKQKAKAGGAKVYGPLPPSESDESEDSDAEYSKGFTFAPKDVSPVTFTPKDNTHGIGYTGLGASSVLGLLKGGGPEPVGGSSKLRGQKGIRGQAFGVGALEDDDDDDVYGMASMSNYDFELTAERKTSGRGTRSRWGRGGQLAIGGRDLAKILEGFTLSSSRVAAETVYPPPPLPPHYVPRAPPLGTPIGLGAGTGGGGPGEKRNAYSRMEVLGEKPDIKSVFDLVNKQDKQKMEAAKSAPPVETSAIIGPMPPVETSAIIGPMPPQASFTSPATLPAAPTQPTQVTPAPSALPQAPPVSGTQALFSGGSLGFKPFGKDPAKQERYDKYLDNKRRGEALMAPPGGSLTEFERQHEVDEFSRAAALYRPMSNMMANRFTTAKFDDDDKTVEVEAEDAIDQSDQGRAAAMKMFGRLTRDWFEWHPERLMCKRFNIANPYPDSTIVGVPNSKRDKMSVFNFLQFPAEEEKPREPLPPPPSEEEKGEESKPKFKPLAILATMDLTRRRPVSMETDMQTSDEAGEVDVSGREEERPPMDLFKAIFADSDSSSPSESDNEEDATAATYSRESHNRALPTASSVSSPQNPADEKSNNAQSATPGSIPMETLEARLSPPPLVQARVRSVNGSDSDSVEAQPSQSSQSSQPPAEMYGPALPPPDSGGGTDSKKSNKKDKHKSSKKHKSKHKKKKSSKHKKKKSKHKKNKKHSRSERKDHSSSGSDADSESDSDVEVTPSDTDLLARLKTLPSHSRPSAADFW